MIAIEMATARRTVGNASRTVSELKPVSATAGVIVATPTTMATTTVGAIVRMGRTAMALTETDLTTMVATATAAGTETATQGTGTRQGKSAIATATTMA